MKFCQERKYTSLHSPNLLIRSNVNTLRQCQNPLMIDAVHRENYAMIETILGTTGTPSYALSTLYESSHGQSQEKESVLSYACHNYLDGHTHILSTMLSLKCDPKFLTRITLSSVGLRRLPFAILHENLEVLDAQQNNLDGYPGSGVDDYQLGWKCVKLKTLNLSKNLFSFIHPEIFHLPHLSQLTMTGNRIRELPLDVWTAPLLTRLELGENMIYELPCPNILSFTDSMSVFSLAINPPHNRRSLSVGGSDHLSSLKRKYISYDVRSTEDLHKSQFGFGLQYLDISENRLAHIPRGLPCLAPLLLTLKLARNSIVDLGTVLDYPSLLQTLDVSNNGITRGIQPPPEQVKIECLQSQLVERHLQCVHYQHNRLDGMRFLYLCGNHIEDLLIENPIPPAPDVFASQVVSDNEAQSEEDNPSLLYPNLQTLKISNNSLVRFPENIHRLTCLRELIVSGNERITELPHGLHKLASLFTFRYEGIRNPIIRELAHLRTTAEVLYYLKARELR